MSDFEKKIQKFNKFYLWLVIAVGVVMVAAITVAVYVSVFAGVIVGIVGALVYLLLLSDEMKRSLGLWYRRIDGGISVSVISPKGKKAAKETERYIPERLMRLDVVAIDAPEGKDAPDALAEVLYIPRSVKRIEAGALSGMVSLSRIIYAGSAEEWAAVVCEDELEEIEVICETQSEEQGNNEDEIS
ncbi:MAG: hypothetical protein IJ011_04550 [Clostridia bacterium]|nr:hypothetical protein [Clostridia bacterium]